MHYSVLGLDLSLTSTGYCYRNPDQEITSGTIVCGDLRGIERLSWLEEQLIQVCREADRDPDFSLTHAIVEGYSMGVKRGNPGRVFDLGEWGGVARMALWKQDVGILCAPPAQVKMFATGNGGSKIKKPEVRQGILDTWNYDIPNHDEADAFVLMHLGEAMVNRRLARRYPQDKSRAIQGVKWLTGNLRD